ncbi:MAG: pyridoxamine 5'-phosphate oxidase family protein [Acidimicrobiia bacterium]
MSLDQLPQGDLHLLDHPVAQQLLESAIPARLGYIAPDSTPRVTPIWFTWNGTEFVFGAAGASPKVRALRANPAVAVTVDSEKPPYSILLVRGRAEIEIVEGAVDEYAESALRYLGPTQGARFRDHAKATFNGMARITVKPEWVGLIDFQTRYPSTY